jgi:hypothetical protein
LPQRSFCVSDKFAQSLAKRNDQLVGNLDAETHLAQFNAAHVGAVYFSLLSKIFP